MAATFASCFANHMLNVAAGTTVDACAYESYPNLNMMKVKALGDAYRKGWLDNVMARITPLTVRNYEDYVIMADLFITEQTTAKTLLEKLSRDMSSFATAAGLCATAGDVPAEMAPHANLYNEIAAKLSRKFNFAAPAAFSCTTIKASEHEGALFIRDFVNKTFERPAARVSAEDYLD